MDNYANGTTLTFVKFPGFYDAQKSCQREELSKNVISFAKKVHSAFDKRLNTKPSVGEDKIDERALRHKDALPPKAMSYSRLVWTIEKLAYLEKGWDSYDAIAPNLTATNNCKYLVDFFIQNDFIPNEVVPSVEGGLGILFISGQKYGYLECDNDGELIATVSDRAGDVHVWETNLSKGQLKITMDRFRKYFG
ncbi:MAG: hypothetical protein K9K88_09855 [Desulfobacterales bacterium]|nr:hypothetical protein [Desulfobacterales bacterium]